MDIGERYMDLKLDIFDPSTLILIAGVLLVFIVQISLCFKSESGFVKALPLLLFVAKFIKL